MTSEIHRTFGQTVFSNLSDRIKICLTESWNYSSDLITRRFPPNSRVVIRFSKWSVIGNSKMEQINEMTNWHFPISVLLVITISRIIKIKAVNLLWVITKSVQKQLKKWSCWLLLKWNTYFPKICILLQICFGNLSISYMNLSAAIYERPGVRTKIMYKF